MRLRRAQWAAVIAAGLASGIGGDDLLARLTEVGARGISRNRLALLRGLFARSLLRAERQNLSLLD